MFLGKLGLLRIIYRQGCKPRIRKRNKEGLVGAGKRGTVAGWDLKDRDWSLPWIPPCDV